MLERFSDPVCGVEVSAMNAGGQREYRGRIYYFCSREHQALFEVDPAEPLVYFALSVTMLLVAECASFVPARQSPKSRDVRELCVTVLSVGVR